MYSIASHHLVVASCLYSASTADIAAVVCGVHQLRLLECVCMCVQVARAHLLVHLHETLTSVSHVFNLHIIAHWFSYSI